MEELHRKGRSIPVNDVWIAATSFCAGATLLTWDARFRAIPRVGALVLET
jgi:predicted nucleic acid-binding protein